MGLSDRAVRLRGEIVGDPTGPAHLLVAWTGGDVSDTDLRGTLLDIWSRIDEPEQAIGSGAWVRLFRAAGFVSQPDMLPAPAHSVKVYRGASVERARGMAWSTSLTTAGHHRLRSDRRGHPAKIYVATVAPDAVLALIDSRGEAEVIVDPWHLDVLSVASLPGVLE